MCKYMKHFIQEDCLVTDEGTKIDVFYLDIQDEPEIFEEQIVP